MSKVDEIKVALAKFGAGDQFQLFYPEDGSGVIADVIGIRIEEEAYILHNLLITFKDAKQTSNRQVVGDTDLSCYGDCTLGNLSISREEDGYLEIANIPAEQIFMLVKPGNEAFISP